MLVRSKEKAVANPLSRQLVDPTAVDEFFFERSEVFPCPKSTIYTV
jgi:hypothetical protein